MPNDHMELSTLHQPYLPARVSMVEMGRTTQFPIPENDAASLDQLNATANQFRRPQRIPEPGGKWLESFGALEGYLDAWAYDVLPKDWTPLAVYWVETPDSRVYNRHACKINHHGQAYLRCDIVTPPNIAEFRRAHIHPLVMTVNLWGRSYDDPRLPKQLAQAAVNLVNEAWKGVLETL